MSEEKKKEVLDQEKNLDESEMEAVSGGKGLCTTFGIGPDGEVCNMGGEWQKRECLCFVAGVQAN